MAHAARTPRIAFVTIGQAPRTDLLPEILQRLQGPVQAEEFGALDDMNAQDIAALHPPPGQASLCTRLRSGQEVVIGKRQTGERLQALFDRLDRLHFDAITLLCTGHFEGLGSKTLLIEAQRVVDATVDALSLGCQHLGVMLPLERQKAEFHVQGDAQRRVTASHYSPYDEAANPARLAQATREVAECDLVVMHCMGYTEAMRAEVAQALNKPVLLARRIVAGAVQQIL